MLRTQFLVSMTSPCTYTSFSDHEDGGSTFDRNVGTYSTAIHNLVSKKTVTVNTVDKQNYSLTYISTDQTRFHADLYVCMCDVMCAHVYACL